MKPTKKRFIAVILLICFAGTALLSGVLAILMQFFSFN